MTYLASDWAASIANAGASAAIERTRMLSLRIMEFSLDNDHIVRNESMWYSVQVQFRQTPLTACLRMHYILVSAKSGGLAAAQLSALLNRRAGHRSVGAVNAAVVGFGTQDCVAFLALIEPLAGVGGTIVATGRRRRWSDSGWSCCQGRTGAWNTCHVPPGR